MITENNQYAMDICMSTLFPLYFIMVFSIGFLVFFAWRKEKISDKINNDEDNFHARENQKLIERYNIRKKTTNFFKGMVYISLFALCANILAIVFLWTIR